MVDGGASVGADTHSVESPGTRELSRQPVRLRKTVHFRLGIGGKLIAAMLFVSIVDILAMSIASRIGFDRGFVAYLNDRGVSRLEALEPVVAQEYASHGSWEFLLESPSIWFNLVGIPGGKQDVPPIGSPIPTHEPIDVSGTSLRITLLDRDRKFIIGHLDDRGGTVERAIRVNEETVGWLTYHPADDVISDADRRFKGEQDLIALFIGIVAIVVAAGLATALAARIINMLRPIRRAVGELASGNYQIELPEKSDDEIGDLSSDVNQLALVLDRTETARRNLMEDLSHELRTPIAILQAELESIRDGVQTSDKDTVRSLLAEVKTLSVLVQDVCDVASSDVGALSYRYESFDLADALDCAIHAFEERRKKAGISLDYSPSSPVLVNGDYGRLNQLFNNLLENSIRYTYKGGKQAISCEADGDLAVLVFEDTAPGVPELELANLFERSFRGRIRVDDGTRGNGLGMTIVQNIVEAHRGQISVEASELGGLKVIIRLPRIRT